MKSVSIVLLLLVCSGVFDEAISKKPRRSRWRDALFPSTFYPSAYETDVTGYNAILEHSTYLSGLSATEGFDSIIDHSTFLPSQPAIVQVEKQVAVFQPAATNQRAVETPATTLAPITTTILPVQPEEILPTVFFSAHGTVNPTEGLPTATKWTNITYKHLEANFGNGFDATFTHFVVPTAGVYEFLWVAEKGSVPAAEAQIVMTAPADKTLQQLLLSSVKLGNKACATAFMSAQAYLAKQSIVWTAYTGQFGSSVAGATDAAAGKFEYSTYLRFSGRLVAIPGVTTRL